MPAAPKGAKKPTDHKAKADRLPPFIEFDYGTDADGEPIHYKIDRGNADNLELMEFVEDAKYIVAIRGYLGADQWAKWKDANRDVKGRVNSDAFEPFLDAVMAAIGGGEESAPNS